MSSNLFSHAFERDLCLTLLQDGELGAKVLARDPDLEHARWADLIAAGRLAHAEGRLKPKTTLKLAAVMTGAGLAREAAEVLLDPGTPYGSKEPLRRAQLAMARLAAAEPGKAAAELASARRAGLDDAGSEPIAALAWALGERAARDLDEAGRLARSLCFSGLADAAAHALAPALAGAGAEVPGGMLETVFETLRLAAPGAARELLAALAAPYAAEGMAEAWRDVLDLLDGRPDPGAEPATAEDGPRRLLLRAGLAEACASARLWPSAIRRFDAAGKKWGDPPDGLCELARCVGRDLIGRLDIRLRPASGARQVVDLFPFNGEFAMLKLKLREMAPWTDRFVLVEADQTFTGLAKPRYFHEAPEAGGEMRGRIVQAPVDVPPAHIGYTWAREFFQKDSSVRALDGLCAPDDLVILSDVDEIIDRAAVEGYQGDLACLGLRTFKYFINCEQVSERPQLKAAVTRARLAAAHGWNYLRLGAIRYRRGAYLAKAGWHFTSIGDPQWLARKMQCTAHEEWSYQDRVFFEKRLRRLRQGEWPGMERREIDDSFPAAIREAREALADFIL